MPTELKFLDSNIWLYALIKEQSEHMQNGKIIENRLTIINPFS
jgi:predicted nucleic acid-binding protein